ncbi:MAG: nicotinate phosphoribosyltransferase [Actinobacteria bacterium]|nr:nicotinate phosphoribosyltransferase [Actinomycetota bacterium]
MSFFIASEESIKGGAVTDVYFERVAGALKGKGINPEVSMEIRAGSLPSDLQWSVFTGLEEVLELIEELPVTVRSIDEGTIFRAGEPVMSLKGRYLDFGIFETAVLGLICQATGIATNAARCKLAAGDRPVISFGARRMHPAIAPMIERNAFVGGCDGVATIESARRIGEEPVGTMSHTLMLCSPNEKDAIEAFDESLDPEIKRVVLIDTFQDEKFGALHAAEILGKKLYAVRLDTPNSRRGDFRRIMEEVRWELDIRGYDHVKLMVSGGLDEYKIIEYNGVADAYGVGTHISNSRVVDFSMDIVEVEGEPFAKRGKKSGLKQLWKCCDCGLRVQELSNTKNLLCPDCGRKMEGLLRERFADGGKLLPDSSPRELRSYVLSQVDGLKL